MARCGRAASTSTVKRPRAPSSRIPHRVGRIEFTGNHHYKDVILRRILPIQEGGRFDERLLRKSIANLNRTSMFESIDAKHVVGEPNEKTGLADMTVRRT